MKMMIKCLGIERRAGHSIFVRKGTSDDGADLIGIFPLPMNPLYGCWGEPFIIQIQRSVRGAWRNIVTTAAEIGIVWSGIFHVRIGSGP